uniref:Nuclear receptor domain-containing protein n=1 Tax=Globodera pallida TaxID=36090 RepID=A0A183CSM9_GLOPA
LGSKIICNMCKKQLKLNDICYSDEAKTKCHCNSRNCCTALGANFICNKCKKQLELDDICYCDDAKAKCHCNSRNCCTVTLKERGKFT